MSTDLRQSSSALERNSTFRTIQSIRCTSYLLVSTLFSSAANQHHRAPVMCSKIVETAACRIDWRDFFTFARLFCVIFLKLSFHQTTQHPPSFPLGYKTKKSRLASDARNKLLFCVPFSFNRTSELKFQPAPSCLRCR